MTFSQTSVKKVQESTDTKGNVVSYNACYKKNEIHNSNKSLESQIFLNLHKILVLAKWQWDLIIKSVITSKIQWENTSTVLEPLIFYNF